MKIATVLALAVGAGVSCFPGRFDDLEKETWVQFAERDNDQVAGDPAVDIAPLDLPSGRTKGGSFVMSHQGVGGVTEVTFDETGGIAERNGAAGNVNVAGGIAPLNNSDVFTVAPFVVSGTITGYLLGQPRFHLDSGTLAGNDAVFSGKVAKFGPKITAGTQVGPNDVQEFGNDIIVGDFGSGAATPDVIVLGALTLTVVPGNGGAARTCGIKRPSFSTAFAMGFRNAALAPVRGNGKNQLVVSGTDLANVPKIFLIESTDIVDSAAVCADSGEIVTGAALDQPPVTIAVGDLNGTGGLDLVTSTSADISRSPIAVIKYYADVNFAAATAPVALAPSADDGATSLYGARMIIDDVDNDGKNELVFSDPTATVTGSTGAGKVYIANFLGASCATTRGPACIEEVLTSSDAGTDNHFGRALATTKFISSKGTKRILGIGERNRMNVFFRVSATADDPRDL